MRFLGRRLRRFRREERGATIVEFALVLIPFLMLIMGLLELGYREYVGVMLDGALGEAARQATIGGVGSTTVQNYVAGRMAVIAPQGTVVVTPTTYADYTDIQPMEPITTDKNQNGVLDSGDCFTDYNNDGVRDANTGSSVSNTSTNIGTSEDVVYYTAVFSFTSFTPIFGLFGWSPNETVKASTMMRNQPYGAEANPNTVCMP